MGLAAPVATCPPLDGKSRSVAVTVYPVVASAESDATRASSRATSTANATDADPMPREAVGVPGATGSDPIATALDAFESGPRPPALRARTVKI